MKEDLTRTPFVDGESRVRTSLKVIGTIVASAFLLGGLYMTLRGADARHDERLADHDKKFTAVETKLAADHDILLEIRGDLKALARERRP